LNATARVIRGRVLSFTGDPAESGSRAYSLIENGAVHVNGGLIEAVGEAPDILARAPSGAVIDDQTGCLITSGLIDAHVHYPQTQVIGSYGAQLLDWLHNYTFVEEQKFADPAHCARVADFFLVSIHRSELLVSKGAYIVGRASTRELPLGHHFHMEPELVVDVALERATARNVSQSTEKVAERVQHSARSYAYRSTSDTASAKRCQLSVSSWSCFLPSAVRR